MRKHYWLFLVLVLIAVCGVGGALAFSVRPPSPEFRYQEEWVRALLQVGLVGVLGVATSVVIERYKDGVQQQRNYSKLQNDSLTELSRTYMDVKLVRRKIQASSTFTNADINELNQLQTDVDLHARNSSGLFRRSVELKSHLDTMKRYLHEVANVPTSAEHREFSSRGFDCFADAYENAAKLMRLEIVSL